MIVIDSSALYAIIAGEPNRGALIRAIVGDPIRIMSAVTLVESRIVVQAKLKEAGVERLGRFLKRARIAVVPFDQDQADLAHAAWIRFGKGRAPASLNLGDCCSYALAKARRSKLLYKGRDFALTDIESAP